MNTIDRYGWDNGPWDDEPDRAEWRDATTGLPCLAVRNAMGIWCGYVGVAPGHPLHRVHYAADHAALGGESPDSRFTVHGGITYSAERNDRICHVPAPGEPEDVWWFGFDCGHSGDIAPGRLDHTGEYRTLGYVQTECRNLARQLAEVRA